MYSQHIPALGRRDVQMSGIRQHFYPEGGWGWVIAVTAVLVQVIAYGLQVGLAVFFIQNPGRTGLVRRAGREMVTIWLPRTGRTNTISYLAAAYYY